MKLISSLVSWFLLLALLAIPAFLFWTWWQKIQHKSSRIQSEAPAPKGTEKIFAGEKEEEPAASPVPARPAAPPASSAAAPAARPAAAVSTEAAPGAEPAARGAEVAASTPPASGVSFARNPFLSKAEVFRFEETLRKNKIAAEEAARRAALLEEQERRRAEFAKSGGGRGGRGIPAPAPLPSRITLQGIISTKGTRSAIVNNEVRRVGDRVLGAEIVDIQGSRVVFKHEGKTFEKVLER